MQNATKTSSLCWIVKSSLIQIRKARILVNALNKLGAVPGQESRTSDISSSLGQGLISFPRCQTASLCWSIRQRTHLPGISERCLKIKPYKYGTVLEVTYSTGILKSSFCGEIRDLTHLLVLIQNIWLWLKLLKTVFDSLSCLSCFSDCSIQNPWSMLWQ